MNLNAFALSSAQTFLANPYCKKIIFTEFAGDSAFTELLEALHVPKEMRPKIFFLELRERLESALNYWFLSDPNVLDLINVLRSMGRRSVIEKLELDDLEKFRRRSLFPYPRENLSGVGRGVPTAVLSGVTENFTFVEQDDVLVDVIAVVIQEEKASGMLSDNVNLFEMVDACSKRWKVPTFLVEKAKKKLEEVGYLVKHGAALKTVLEENGIRDSPSRSSASEINTGAHVVGHGVSDVFADRIRHRSRAFAEIETEFKPLVEPPGMRLERPFYNCPPRGWPQTLQSDEVAPVGRFTYSSIERAMEEQERLKQAMKQDVLAPRPALVIVEKIVKEAPAPPVAAEKKQPVEEAEDKTCVVCMDQQRAIAFAPCGHVCCCVKCSESVAKCPMCQAAFTLKLKVFL